MSNLKKIGNKLFKETTELKSHDVELALVDDAKKVRGEFASVAEKEDGYFSFVVKAESEGEEVLREYKQLLKKIESITPKLENAINELGINRNNFGVLEDLDNAKSKVKERISKISKNVNKLKSINP
jgi:DNA repair exonuclease SbcCD ATPase subunit